MPRKLSRIVVAAVAAAVTAVAAGCGGQEAATVKTAFEKPIERGNVQLTLAADVMGRKVSFGAGGPFSSNGEGKLPSLDWRVSATGATPQPIEARVITSATNAFVEYGGQTYEVGEDKVAQVLAQQGKGSKPSNADVDELLRKMQGWFPDTGAQQDATLDGEDVTRITGKLDLSKAIAGIQDIAKDQPGVQGSQELQQLSGADIAKVERYVEDPTFTIDTAKSDGTLRRIVAQLRLKDIAGGGTVSFTVQFKDVGKAQTITPPTSGRPIEELGEQLKSTFGAAAAPALAGAGSATS